MKRAIEKAESAVRREFPIASATKGWFLRTDEVSAGVYRVEGTDQWGRKVSRTGSDLEELMAACEEDIRAIEGRSDRAGGGDRARGD